MSIRWAHEHDAIPANFEAVEVRESFKIARGKPVNSKSRVYMHPADLMLLQNNGRTPLHTRHCLGVREAERDRRRHG